MTEFLYRLVKADDLKHHFYYMGADNGISANELCLQIDSCLALSTHREQNTGDEMLWIDSRLPYNLADEVSCTCFYDAKACIQMLCKLPILHGWTVTYYMYFYLRLYMASNRLLFQPFFQLADIFSGRCTTAPVLKSHWITILMYGLRS
mgnify:CR=1 FL=1